MLTYSKCIEDIGVAGGPQEGRRRFMILDILFAAPIFENCIWQRVSRLLVVAEIPAAEAKILFLVENLHFRSKMNIGLIAEAQIIFFSLEFVADNFVDTSQIFTRSTRNRLVDVIRL